MAYDDPDKKIYHLCIVNLVIGLVSSSCSLLKLRKDNASCFLHFLFLIHLKYFNRNHPCLFSVHFYFFGVFLP